MNFYLILIFPFSFKIITGLLTFPLNNRIEKGLAESDRAIWVANRSHSSVSHMMWYVETTPSIG